MAYRWVIGGLSLNRAQGVLVQKNLTVDVLNAALALQPGDCFTPQPLMTSFCDYLSALRIIHYHCPPFMPDFYLSYLNSRFHGTCEGAGEELLICLHGFGESAAHFHPLTETLGDRYTIVALDMPLHGGTQWEENRVFEKDDLVALVQMVLQQQGKERFSLLGYSMGGRLSLCLVEKLAGRIDHLILAAADGLRNNPWHMFVTQTTAGNKIFKYNTYHPRLFFTLLHTWRKLGLLNQSIYKFVLHRMNEPEKREQVYNVWTNLRHMMPDKKHCKQLLSKYNVLTLLVFGRYDRVIPPVLGTRFADGSFPSKIVVMEKGHQLISAQLGLIIKTNL